MASFSDDSTGHDRTSSRGVEQYNQYQGGGKDEPHEHFWYNTTTGKSGWHGENVSDEEKKEFGKSVSDMGSLHQYRWWQFKRGKVYFSPYVLGELLWKKIYLLKSTKIM